MEYSILIIGGSGFIGRHMHEALRGTDIVNMDLCAPSWEAHSVFVEGDVREESDISAVLEKYNIGVVILLAAEHKDFGVADDEYYQTNVVGAGNVVEASRKAGISRLVFYSSVAIYGDPGKPSDEGTTPAPINPYGKTKLQAEGVIREWAKEDKSVSILVMRPAVVYGEYNHANLFRLIQQIDKKLYFDVGDGINIKSMAYVKNLVGATFHFLSVLPTGVSTYNYADEPQLQTKEMSQIIAGCLDIRPPRSMPLGLLLLAAIPFDLIKWVSGKDLPISTSRVRKLGSSTHHTALKASESGYISEYDNKMGLDRMVSWMKREGYLKQRK